MRKKSTVGPADRFAREKLADHTARMDELSVRIRALESRVSILERDEAPRVPLELEDRATDKLRDEAPRVPLELEDRATDKLRAFAHALRAGAGIPDAPD